MAAGACARPRAALMRWTPDLKDLDLTDEERAAIRNAAWA